MNVYDRLNIIFDEFYMCIYLQGTSISYNFASFLNPQGVEAFFAEKKEATGLRQIPINP